MMVIIIMILNGLADGLLLFDESGHLLNLLMFDCRLLAKSECRLHTYAVPNIIICRITFLNRYMYAYMENKALIISLRRAGREQRERRMREELPPGRREMETGGEVEAGSAEVRSKRRRFGRRRPPGDEGGGVGARGRPARWEPRQLKRAHLLIVVPTERRSDNTQGSTRCRPDHWTSYYPACRGGDINRRSSRCTSYISGLPPFFYASN